MEDLILTLCLVGMTTALILYYLLGTKANKYPPGPLAFPVVGNLPQLALAGSLTAFANRYRKTYGDAFTFTFGRNKRVVLSGYDVMRELLVKNGDISSNRSTKLLSKSAQALVKKDPGVIWAPFPHWKTLRSFAISTLREEGMGKASLEPEIQEEIEHYLSTFIEPNLGKPIQLKKGLCRATSNIISQLMYRRRSEYDDVKFNRLMDAIEEIITISVRQSVISSLPDIFGKLFAGSLVNKSKELSKEIIRPMLKSFIHEHKVDLDHENPRDLTDRFLVHSASDNKEPCFSESNCETFELQLYLAGTDTTATALTWGLLFMCLHPEKQERVQQEIDSVIGRDRPASCKDRAGMLYTDAVLFETLRKGNIAPTALPHTLEKDMIVGGTLIPAGAELMLNMSSVLNDETVFEEPDKFKPERYLTGDIAQKKQRTIAFGLGRRACLGESLAKMELFLFFTTLLQKYRVRLLEGSMAAGEFTESVVRSPKPFDIIFVSR